jgi:VanZ family protein
MIAIADEIHQSVIPARDASITDVFLDAIGILLAIYLVLRLYKNKKIAEPSALNF